MADNQEIDMTEFNNNILGTYGRIAASRYGPDDMDKTGGLVDNLLDQEKSGEFIDARDRKRGSIANRDTVPLAPDIAAQFELDGGIEPVGPGPSIAGIESAVASPTVSKRVKNNALANALDNQTATDYVTDIIQGMSGNRKSAIAKVAENARLEAQAGADVGQLQLTAGQLRADQIRAKATQDTAKAADIQGFVSRSGIDTAQLDSKVNQVTAANVRLFEQMLPLRKQINDLQAVSFLDDPAVWLANQFILPSMIQQHNALLGQINAGTDFIKSQDSLVTSTVNANAGKMAAMNTKEVEAAANEQMVKAQLHAREAAIASAKLAGATDAKIEAINQHYDSLALTLDQRNQMNLDREVQRENQAIQRDLATQQRTANTQIAIDKQVEREKVAADKKDMDDKIASAAAVLHLPGITTLADLKRRPKKDQEAIAGVIDSEGNSLGKTPTQVADNWTYIQNAYSSADQRKSVENEYPNSQAQLAAYVKLEVQKQREILGKTLAGEKLNEAVNTAIETKFRQMKDSPEGFTDSVNGNATNWYKIPALSQVAKLPSLGGNLLGTSVVETQAVKQDGKDVTSAGALTTLASKVKDQTVNISDAARDAVAFYQTATDSQNSASMKFSKFAAPIQDTYNVSISGKKYNMLNPVQATKAILKLMENQTGSENAIRAMSMIQ